MHKRGVRPKNKIKIIWSANFAYGIGLLVTDGCLSSDGRHITFVSKDMEQIENFRGAFGLRDIKTGQTTSGHKGKRVHRLQFGDVVFYRFLEGIGLTSAKSKTIGSVDIPNSYLFDFLRGCFDGDGTFYSYWDPRWKSSFMFYTEFISASKKHILWLQEKLYEILRIRGHITNDKKGATLQLKYAKKDSLKLLNKLYSNKKGLFLKRKKLKVVKALAIVGLSLKK
ncbi:MAG: hypothetical protein A3E93_01615 [Candidatus Zambryskibacteria bacterium RIFCSPHIGHO2_12_FULL_43_12b]|uniref:Homing endonuclease LAGLIDADG domain-containing protein n=1 Tax=Candidatus Zambryskibacteria bacterium RIFCSPLOWO2_01_FULL_43_17 TaxID=1802760 RepID=A0A1G2U4Z8_9BACT|nr:MAG: hypothetical protein A3E93_01615 [Candidatus Zambryskibacteria bacterium RIFCSPHIGHO2_12_FULL_43_12b]OHB04573.1 MAG: hypothetical protein A2920_01345 [Candidatus Zambryskibacteria bacterium RIFCSPLOWO2_01_FULL_43_17]